MITPASNSQHSCSIRLKRYNLRIHSFPIPANSNTQKTSSHATTAFPCMRNQITPRQEPVLSILAAIAHPRIIVTTSTVQLIIHIPRSNTDRLHANDHLHNSTTIKLPPLRSRVNTSTH
ncbi:hypothetical protein KC19_4G083400 [Ceratodon purpureus]|uniref:Uncharacterized protein n=1 Tax=Ceratodon purpureus TaxID=3225 RepID=A0A8T0I6D4_CERPU|nr:hypothetical protein KC19_4G083400 [Ceratodon purpureus]